MTETSPTLLIILLYPFPYPYSIMGKIEKIRIRADDLSLDMSNQEIRHAVDEYMFEMRYMVFGQ